MAIATGTAIAIAAGMSMAGKAIGAKVQSNAAKKAAGTIQDASGQMISHANQVYAPYLGMGSGAMTTLGDLMGVEPGAVPQYGAAAGPGGRPAGNNPLVGQAAPRPSTMVGQPPPQMPSPQMPPGPPPPQPMSVEDMGMMPPEQIAQQRTQSGYGPGLG